MKSLMSASNDRWRLTNPLNDPKPSAAERNPQNVDKPVPPSAPPPWQPRFGLKSIMLILVVTAVAATGGRLLVRGLNTDTTSRAVFVIFVLVVPVVLLVLLNLFRLAIQYWQRRK